MKNLGIALACLALVVGGYLTFTQFGEQTSSGIPTESPERLERIEAMAQTWPKQPDFSRTFDPLNPSAAESLLTGQQNTSFNVQSLPVAENGAHELVTAYCSGCHSLSIVTQQRASRERWQELLVWMEQKQGMAKLPDADEKIVLDYLSSEY